MRLPTKASKQIVPKVQPGFTCPAAGVIQTSITNDNSQLGRLFRDSIQSTCPSKAYPGILNAGTTYNYATVHYANVSGAAACVTVNFDPDTGTTPCNNNAHMSAYLNSYDPNDQATNFVGDVGSSDPLPFSFEVPADTSLILVTTNTTTAASCDFAYEVVSLPCQLPQAITGFSATPPSGIVDGEATLSVSGSGASGNPIVYASTTTGVCTVSGSTVTFLAAGACNITANQAGNTEYTAASEVNLTIQVIEKQVITGFSATPPSGIVDGEATLSVTGNGASGNPVVYASTTTGVCSVSGSTVTFLTAGVCNITANQAGNTEHAAASEVNLTIQVVENKLLLVFRQHPQAVL